MLAPFTPCGVRVTYLTAAYAARICRQSGHKSEAPRVLDLIAGEATPALLRPQSERAEDAKPLLFGPLPQSGVGNVRAARAAMRHLLQLSANRAQLIAPHQVCGLLTALAAEQ